MFSCHNQLCMTCNGRWCHVAQVQLVISCNVQVEKSCTIKSSFFWDATEPRLPTFREKLSVPSSRVKLSKMGPIGCPETSVTNYQSTPRNIPENRRAHLHLRGSLQSRIRTIMLLCTSVYHNLILLAAAWSSVRRSKTARVRLLQAACGRILFDTFASRIVTKYMYIYIYMCVCVYIYIYTHIFRFS